MCLIVFRTSWESFLSKGYVGVGDDVGCLFEAIELDQCQEGYARRPGSLCCRRSLGILYPKLVLGAPRTLRIPGHSTDFCTHSIFPGWPVDSIPLSALLNMIISIITFQTFHLSILHPAII